MKLLSPFVLLPLLKMPLEKVQLQRDARVRRELKLRRGQTRRSEDALILVVRVIEVKHRRRIQRRLGQRRAVARIGIVHLPRVVLDRHAARPGDRRGRQRQHQRVVKIIAENRGGDCKAGRVENLHFSPCKRRSSTDCRPGKPHTRSCRGSTSCGPSVSKVMLVPICSKLPVHFGRRSCRREWPNRWRSREIELLVTDATNKHRLARHRR